MNHAIKEEQVNIEMQEDLISSTSENILAEWKDIFSQLEDQTTLNLNLNKVNMVDSQGLNLIIALYKECDQKGMTLRIQECTAPIKRLFSLFKLSHLLENN